jgi:hypothetical protein
MLLPPPRHSTQFETLVSSVEWHLMTLSGNAITWRAICVWPLVEANLHVLVRRCKLTPGFAVDPTLAFSS